MYKRTIAVIFALALVLGIIAGIAAPAFAEGPDPHYNAEENEIAFWNILEVDFGQTVDPAQPFQCGYAKLSMDGVEVGYIPYTSIAGETTLYGKWFFQHGSSVYLAESNYCITLTLNEQSSEWSGWYLCRVDETSLTGSISLGFTESGPCLEWTNVHEIAKVHGVETSADSDLADAWEKYIVATGRNDAITVGTSETTFSPDRTITRAQAVAMLWRAFDCPEPETAGMPFTDVPEDAYYFTAVLWAAEKGITVGTSDTTFSPKRTCSRGEIAQFCYRAMEHKDGEKPYSNTSWTVYIYSDEVEYAWERSEVQDVPPTRYYSDSVGWSILSVPIFAAGLSPNSFGPNEPCTRALCLLYVETVAGN